MRRTLIVLILLSTPATALAENAALVNGQTITSAQVNVAEPKAAKDPAQMASTLQALISRQLLVQVAEKNGWNKTPEVVANIKNQRNQILATVAADNYWSEHPITPEDIKNNYKNLLSEYSQKEYRYRDIIIPDRSNADDILQQLKKGASFSILANKFSTGSNAQIGGETGWVAAKAVPADFMPSLQNSHRLEITGPISVPSGWAIIQKLNEKEMPKPSLKEARGSIESSLRNAQLGKYLEKLRKSATIIIPKKVQEG